ncbi:MAG: mechanosensitive ion channel family protein [Phycisphaerae bacterium]|nr:mechanosensitive ion channel family protein [Phycisphaerae bacterium]
MEDFFTTRVIIYYFSAIVALALLGGIVLRGRLIFLEKIRKKRLSKVKSEDLLASPIDKDGDYTKIKQQSLNSLEKRFSITRRALYLILIPTALFIALIPVIGKISPTIIPVIIACSSVILGIAAKPLIENFMCGLVLCFGKLARIGDIVLVDNEYGTIEDVTLTHCIIRRWDWLRYVVPNSSMMTKEFVNYSLRDNYRWVYVEFWVDYSADMVMVEKISKSCPITSEYYSGKEDSEFWIVELTPQSAKCMVVAWATSPAEGWMLSIDMRKNLLLEFKKHGIQTHLQNITFHNKAKGQRTGA